MKRTVLGWLLVFNSFVLSSPCSGQNILEGHKVRGLKGITGISVVLSVNTLTEFFTTKEWTDIVELGLHSKVPELNLRDTNDAPWLELSVITTRTGGNLELSVYRWVRVLDSKEEILAKVWWDSRAVYGNLSKKGLKEELNILLTSFAADYVRSKC